MTFYDLNAGDVLKHLRTSLVLTVLHVSPEAIFLMNDRAHTFYWTSMSSALDHDFRTWWSVI